MATERRSADMSGVKTGRGPARKAAGDGDTQYSAPAAECAARILLLLAHVGEPQILTDLARETNSTKSLAFRVIRELERAELVRKLDDQRYQLGLAALELGAAVVTRSSQPGNMREILTDLSQETGQTVNVGVLRDFDVLFLMKQDAPRAVVTISHVGMRLPASCSALGKVLLSQLPEKELLVRMPTPLPRLTSKSPTDPDALLRDIQRVHERGYATDLESAILGRAAIAIPITLPHLPGIPGALAATASLDDFEDERESLLVALRQARSRFERANAARDRLHIADEPGLTD